MSAGVGVHYLLRIREQDAAEFEKWFGSRLAIGPAVGSLDAPDGNIIERGVTVPGIDAITDEEYESIARRLRTSGPLYHAGGP